MSKIKQKIHEHTDSYSAKIFEEWLNTDKVFVKPYYTFPKEVFSTELSFPIAKSLSYNRDNSDSEKMIKLGRLWTDKAGTNYRYFIVFNK